MIDNFQNKANTWDNPQKIRMTTKFSNELSNSIFLYKEDMDKFARGLRYAIEFIETGIDPEEGKEEIIENRKFDKENPSKFSNNHDDEDIVF